MRSDSPGLYAVQTRRTPKALAAASQTEKDKVPLPERTAIRALAMDDGGYAEIVL